jgi:hypothetical protein
MFTDAYTNTVLDLALVTGDKLSLHTAYSITGANEITGGTYARTAATFGAAASRQKAISAAVDLTGLPAAAVVAWIGVWNTGGTVFKGMAANGGSEFAFQVGVTANTIIAEAHGLVNDERVAFTGTPPAGLTEGTHYFVVGVTAGDPDTFQVAATQGGAAIDITGQPAVNCMASKIIIETYAGAGGTHRVNTHITKM